MTEFEFTMSLAQMGLDSATINALVAYKYRGDNSFDAEAVAQLEADLGIDLTRLNADGTPIGSDPEPTPEPTPEPEPAPDPNDDVNLQDVIKASYDAGFAAGQDDMFMKIHEALHGA